MMRFQSIITVEYDAFNKESAERRVEDLLAKAKLKKFEERNTVISDVTFERIDNKEEEEEALFTDETF